MSKHKVFVYGSLKRGFGNHSLLGESKFIGVGNTSGQYVMISLGAFPAVLDFGSENNKQHVIGEVYLVDDNTLTRLDRLEGHPDWYKRTIIDVVLNGKTEQVSMYIMGKSSFSENEIPNLDILDTKNGIYEW